MMRAGEICRRALLVVAAPLRRGHVGTHGAWAAAIN
jgi:hypothetical protein